MKKKAPAFSLEEMREIAASFEIIDAELHKLSARSLYDRLTEYEKGQHSQRMILVRMAVEHARGDVRLYDFLAAEKAKKAKGKPKP